MGWQALEQWGHDVTRIEPLAGGVANQVWSVRVNGQLAVGRLGARSDADLAWETDLLRHLDREGLAVPVPIASPRALAVTVLHQLSPNVISSQPNTITEKARLPPKKTIARLAGRESRAASGM